MAESEPAVEANDDGPSLSSSSSANAQPSTPPTETAAKAGPPPTTAPETAAATATTTTPAQSDSKPATDATSAPPATTMAVEVTELDDFGLPVRKFPNPPPIQTGRLRRISNGGSPDGSSTSSRKLSLSGIKKAIGNWEKPKAADLEETQGGDTDGGDVDGDDANSQGTPASNKATPVDGNGGQWGVSKLLGIGRKPSEAGSIPTTTEKEKEKETDKEKENEDTPKPDAGEAGQETNNETSESNKPAPLKAAEFKVPEKFEDQAITEAKKSPSAANPHNHDTSNPAAQAVFSEFSHQQLIVQEPKKEDADDDEWQTMPAYASYDMYDDDNRLIAREHVESGDEGHGPGRGGAGKGYTRVFVDDDAESATSMDENTQYLFKDAGQGTSIIEDDQEQRDAVSQLQATKNLLTEGQRIAYVGLTRLELSSMTKAAENIKHNRGSKKEVRTAAESMKMWSQKMMIRLYTHMDISSAEQLMIEQLSSHGVVPKDLTPVLMANARVKNPMAEKDEPKTPSTGDKSPRPPSIASSAKAIEEEEVATPPPPYAANANEEELSVPVRMPSEMPTTDKIDIDLRWTVLCDLFLVLIADSVYDSRSRVLLENVGKALDIPWLDIYRFEKKVTDALEMQQDAEKEDWNEDEHMENRRKMALRRRYVMMGLATVGGGLVIGLSAGLLAPVIGAGLAAGFTTIGVTGTSGFLAGAGGAAIITSGAAASGSVIGVRAANRRTGAVKTFEYRPLHNNKRVNLIVTVSGWMTGKVDDVRLPYSTVDPIMGDIYSVLWEPEMLTSMGDTINILATEALTQGLQQVLGSTILVSLMAALQLPVVLTKLAYLIDNPWAVSLDRATAAGLILADSLVDRNLGTRPVTLVGYSLGSRVIFSCLQELARKGAFGIVQNVIIFGSPVVVKQDEWIRARTVVNGRFVNGYNRNDWILGYLFRLTNGGIRRIAGLAAVEGIQGVENMDLTEEVKGHMEYRKAMPRLLRGCGWLVESDEFTEIEDPDPENHGQRQRELINEIEEARKELEKEGKGNKGAFGFFSRRKKGLKREEWEVYEDSAKDGAKGGSTEDKEGNNHGVLFDIDAIRAELSKEQEHTGGKIDPVDEELLQVREIKSTLPPMKLDLGLSPSPSPAPSLTPSLAPPPSAKARRGSLRESKSAEAVATSYRPSHEYRPSQEYRPSREIRRSADHSAPSPTTRSSAGTPSPRGVPELSTSASHSIADDDGDDGIQMTFDTSFDDSVRSATAPPPPPKDHQPSRGDSGASAPATTTAAAASTVPPRPDMKTAQTVPNITLSDPWIEDEEDFGKEKEISMTFA